MTASAPGESRTTTSEFDEVDRQRALLAAVQMAVRRYGVCPPSATADDGRTAL